MCVLQVATCVFVCVCVCVCVRFVKIVKRFEYPATTKVLLAITSPSRSHILTSNFFFLIRGMTGGNLLLVK